MRAALPKSLGQPPGRAPELLVRTREPRGDSGLSVFTRAVKVETGSGPSAGSARTDETKELTMPSPQKRRDPLAIGTELLAAIAYLCSYWHVKETVLDSGQAELVSWFIAAMPEVSTLLCILKIRRDGARQIWPWVVGGTAAALTLSCNFYQAEPTVWGWVIAGWPAWSALGAMAMATDKKKRRRTPVRKTAAKKQPQQLRRAA